ncbi:hypothetical protein LSH36_375g03017 [Paralvinella palmiformis]|uniref:Uncharacterized protein n=1 Tax=Paralvinella palmiformis TaxID=53620 RepID=A0AAD9JEX0_9ANNE|nr:hypothetical protein LSH36_375g03017 [Paralvinella palmiformis]
MAEYKPSADVTIHWVDPMMFYFLVTDPTKQIFIKSYQSGAVLIYNTEWVFASVLWWMYLCSLEGRCCPQQTKNDMLGISEREYRKKVPFASHCTDQSALNILLSNAYGFNESKYVAPSLHLTFKRKITHYYNIHMCDVT